MKFNKSVSPKYCKFPVSSWNCRTHQRSYGEEQQSVPSPSCCASFPCPPLSHIHVKPSCNFSYPITNAFSYIQMLAKAGSNTGCCRAVVDNARFKKASYVPSPQRLSHSKATQVDVSHIEHRNAHKRKFNEKKSYEEEEDDEESDEEWDKIETENDDDDENDESETESDEIYEDFENTDDDEMNNGIVEEDKIVRKMIRKMMLIEKLLIDKVKIIIKKMKKNLKKKASEGYKRSFCEEVLPLLFDFESSYFKLYKENEDNWMEDRIDLVKLIVGSHESDNEDTTKNDNKVIELNIKIKVRKMMLIEKEMIDEMYVIREKRKKQKQNFFGEEDEKRECLEMLPLMSNFMYKFYALYKESKHRWRKYHLKIEDSTSLS